MYHNLHSSRFTEILYSRMPCVQTKDAGDPNKNRPHKTIVNNFPQLNTIGILAKQNAFMARSFNAKFNHDWRSKCCKIPMLMSFGIIGLVQYSNLCFLLVPWLKDITGPADTIKHVIRQNAHITQAVSVDFIGNIYLAMVSLPTLFLGFVFRCRGSGTQFRWTDNTMF